jgi:hypothetical protein
VIRNLISALWLGSAFFLMLAASAAFRAAPNAMVAADVVGAMLNRWHYIALGAPLLLFALELQRTRRVVAVVLFVAILAAAAQIVVDLRIREMRHAVPGGIATLEPHHPIRRRFGALHGASMLLLVIQGLAALTVILSRADGEGPPAGTATLGGGPSPSDAAQDDSDVRQPTAS